jgi:hypothetical protein
MKFLEYFNTYNNSTSKEDEEKREAQIKEYRLSAFNKKTYLSTIKKISALHHLLGLGPNQPISLTKELQKSIYQSDDIDDENPEEREFVLKEDYDRFSLLMRSVLYEEVDGVVRPAHFVDILETITKLYSKVWWFGIMSEEDAKEKIKTINLIDASRHKTYLMVYAPREDPTKLKLKIKKSKKVASALLKKDKTQYEEPTESIPAGLLKNLVEEISNIRESDAYKGYDFIQETMIVNHLNGIIGEEKTTKKGYGYSGGSGYSYSSYTEPKTTSG